MVPVESGRIGVLRAPLQAARLVPSPPMAKGVIKAENLITGKIELKDIMEKGFFELINNKDENIKILVRP